MHARKHYNSYRTENNISTAIDANNCSIYSLKGHALSIADQEHAKEKILCLSHRKLQSNLILNDATALQREKVAQSSEPQHTMASGVKKHPKGSILRVGRGSSRVSQQTLFKLA